MRTAPSRAEPTGDRHRWPIAWALAVTQTSGAFSLAGGSLAVGALVMAWSFVDSLAALNLVQAGIGLVLAAVTYEVAFTVVARSFSHDRIRALLLVTMVAGLASTIFVPLATGLVETLGWRPALRVLAVVLWLGTVPLHALVLRRAPQRAGAARTVALQDAQRSAPEHDAEARDVEARDAWRDATFWWLAAAAAIERARRSGASRTAIARGLSGDHGVSLSWSVRRRACATTCRLCARTRRQGGRSASGTRHRSERAHVHRGVAHARHRSHAHAVPAHRPVA